METFLLHALIRWLSNELVLRRFNQFLHIINEFLKDMNETYQNLKIFRYCPNYHLLTMLHRDFLSLIYNYRNKIIIFDK